MTTREVQRECWSYSNSQWPFIGALIDYIGSIVEYIRCGNFDKAEALQKKRKVTTVSKTFLATVCLVFGLIANVKFEVVTFNGDPLPNDLHFVLLSKDDKLYADDVDVDRAMWCIEASDCLTILISSVLVWNSYFLRFPLRQYMFLPWLGATLRGLFMRQVPTACALVYTMAIIDGSVNPLFITAFLLLLLLEARLLMDMARYLHNRWLNDELVSHNTIIPLEENLVRTLWTNDDAPSFEVRNFVY